LKSGRSLWEVPFLNPQEIPKSSTTSETNPNTTTDGTDGTAASGVGVGCGRGVGGEKGAHNTGFLGVPGAVDRDGTYLVGGGDSNSDDSESTGGHKDGGSHGMPTGNGKKFDQAAADLARQETDFGRTTAKMGSVSEVEDL
jgi:hypothetical protein